MFFALLNQIDHVQSQSTSSCVLPHTFNSYFEDALLQVETKIDKNVVQALDEIGLAPLGNSLVISNVLNLKSQVFDRLFGTATERHSWINVSSDINVFQHLSSNLNRIVGEVPPTLSVTCKLEATDDLEDNEVPYRLALQFSVAGSLAGADLTLSTLSPSIAILPEESFPPLDLAIEAINANYELTIPFTIDTKRKKFMVGEILVNLDATFSSQISQSLPLTADVSTRFQGNLDMSVAFSYSSIHDWLYTGNYAASLMAETSVGTKAANLGLRAFDDDVFDDNPREYIDLILCYVVLHLQIHESIPFLPQTNMSATVLFDFDACDYTNLLKNSIKSLSLTGELNPILDTYLDPVLNRAPFLPEHFSDSVKAAIVFSADAKVNEVKGAIVSQLDALSGHCASRRLGLTQVEEDGSQRMLQKDLTFSSLAASINVLGVVSF